jgi:hypothetical protein
VRVVFSGVFADKLEVEGGDGEDVVVMSMTSVVAGGFKLTLADGSNGLGPNSAIVESLT